MPQRTAPLRELCYVEAWGWGPSVGFGTSGNFRKNWLRLYEPFRSDVKGADADLTKNEGRQPCQAQVSVR